MPLSISKIRSHRSKSNWIVTPAERGEELGNLPSIEGGMNQEATQSLDEW